MPRLLWLMFWLPMSSPQMTRMLGFLAVGAWAVAAVLSRPSVKADAVTSKALES